MERRYLEKIPVQLISIASRPFLPAHIPVFYNQTKKENKPTYIIVTHPLFFSEAVLCPRVKINRDGSAPIL
jgi:hypothetical protein